jgi:hypothetical protein
LSKQRILRFKRDGHVAIISNTVTLRSSDRTTALGGSRSTEWKLRLDISQEISEEEKANFNILIRDIRGDVKISKHDDIFSFTATNKLKVSLLSFKNKIEKCEQQGKDILICRVARCNPFGEIRTKDIIGSGDIEVLAAFKSKMSLFVIGHNQVVRFSNEIDTSNVSSNSELLESWMKDEGWDAKLVVPGYLWISGNGHLATRLEVRVSRDNLLAHALQVSSRKRDPVYWALGSEGLIKPPPVQPSSPPQPAKSPNPKPPVLEEPIEELITYLLQPERTIWSEYLPKISRAAGMPRVNNALDAKQPRARLQRLHLSAAASFLFAQSLPARRSREERIDEFRDSCDRATDALIAISDLKQTSSRANIEGVDAVHLDVELVRIEACLCAGEMSPKDARLAVTDLITFVNRSPYNEYYEILYALLKGLGPNPQKRLAPKLKATLCDLPKGLR